MVLCVSDAANAEGEKGAMKFRWQRKPLGMSIDCGVRDGRGGMKCCADVRRGWVRELFHFFPVRQSVVDRPKRFLKRCERCAAVLKPHSFAITDMVASDVRRR